MHALFNRRWVAAGLVSVAIGFGSPAAAPAAQVTTLISGTVLNGGFETVTNSVPQYWVPAPGTGQVSAQTKNGNNVHSGNYAVVIDKTDNSSAAIDTTYKIQTGDNFSLNFYVFGGSNSVTGDQMNWNLFYTSTDLIGGTATSVASGSVSITNGSWVGYTPTIAAATSAANNKELFLAFTNGTGAVAGRYYRLDDVSLTVSTPEPTIGAFSACTIALFGLGARRRRSRA